MPHFLKKLILLTVITFAATMQAIAHSHLASSVPADKAVIAAAPSELQLKFSEPVNPAKSGIVLNGPDKAEIKTAVPAAGSEDGLTLLIPMSQPLVPGEYTVMWHALSADSHKSKGEFSFTIKP